MLDLLKSIKWLFGDGFSKETPAESQIACIESLVLAVKETVPKPLEKTGFDGNI